MNPPIPAFAPETPRTGAGAAADLIDRIDSGELAPGTPLAPRSIAHDYAVSHNAACWGIQALVERGRAAEAPGSGTVYITGPRPDAPERLKTAPTFLLRVRQLAAALRDRIDSGDLAPGCRITATDLMHTYGVTRPLVNKALRKLAEEQRLIVLTPPHMTMVYVAGGLPDAPRYLHVARTVCREVLAGTTPPGRIAPSVEWLAAHHATSPATVSKGFQVLHRCGVLDFDGQDYRRIAPDALHAMSAVAAMLALGPIDAPTHEPQLPEGVVMCGERAETISDQLACDIASGDLAPGARLTWPGVAKEFAAGGNAARRAIEILAERGLVDAEGPAPRIRARVIGWQSAPTAA